MRLSREILCFMLISLLFTTSFNPVSFLHTIETASCASVDFSITALENTKAQYLIGETVEIWVIIKNTGTETIDAYALEASFTLISPNNNKIALGKNWNGWGIPSGDIHLIDTNWVIPSNAEGGWYGCEVSVTHKPTGLTKKISNAKLFEVITSPPDIDLIGEFYVNGVKYSSGQTAYINGTSVNVKYVVWNIGSQNANSFYVRYKFTSPNGTYSEEKQYPGLSAGSIITHEKTFSNLILGKECVAHMNIDFMGNVAEKNETNNSPYVFIEVAAKQASTFTIWSSHDVITYGSYITIEGSISPIPSGGFYTDVYYTKPDGFTEVHRTVHAGGRSSFTVDYYKPDAVGVWSVYAVWPGNSELEGSISNTMTFQVTSEGFTIETHPIQIGVYQGEQGQVTVNVESASPQPYSVTLTASGFPPSTSYYFNASSGNPPFTAILTIITSANTPLGEYTITIKAVGGGYESQVTFTLNIYPAAQITVISPNGGETWLVGSTQTIRWNGVGFAENVRIELSRDGGSTWNTIIASTPNDGSESWVVTGPSTTYARIKVTSIDNPNIWDVSDSSFNIISAPSQAYVLHVHSSPITGIEISYSGDYSGSGTTNFDIGPKDSSFTVTLTAPSTIQNYKFDHWELDGVNMGGSIAITVKVDSQERVAVAVYSSAPEVVLNFDVLYEDKLYDVSLQVPSASFNLVTEKFPSIWYTWFASIDPQILKGVLYLYMHIENPSRHPVLNVLIQTDGQKVVDRNLKIKVLNGLLLYCYELSVLASPPALENYKSLGEQWLKAHEDLRWTVFISDLVSGGLYFATIIAPLIDTIQGMFSDETAEQVGDIVSFIYELLTSGKDGLIKEYGYDAAKQITDILESSGLISTDDYNTMELYQNIIKDPAKSADVICQIRKNVFNVETEPNAKSLVDSFIRELPGSTIGDFAAGTVLSLMAYYGSGLTAQTAMQIGTSTMFGTFFGYTIPLTLAAAIHENCITPMAQTLHAAWETMKQESDAYFQLFEYAKKIANPIENKFNLTNVQLFSSLHGLRCIIEFEYYMNAYLHTKGQLLNPKHEQEASMLKDSAQSALSQAEDWADFLGDIREYAEAIVNLVDPEGTTFNFTFQQPIISLPAAPPNSSGFAIIANSTTSITVKSGQYCFTVQNREWFTNFTYAIFVDDPYSRVYIIIFNPFEGDYEVKSQNETLIRIVNFEPSTDGVTLSTSKEMIATHIAFTIIYSGEKPEFYETNPWWAQHQLWILTGATVAVVTLTVSVVLLKKRKKQTKLNLLHITKKQE